MDAHAYLQRIGYVDSLQADLKSLEAIAKAHLQSVPFENFDVHLGRRIRLDEESLSTKIVRRRRGGFCYELNGLFALLLRELGYEVDLLSARVFRQGKSGQDFDHMALRVTTGTRCYLVDIGFGAGSCLPIELKAGASREDRGNLYRLHKSSRGLLFEMEAANGDVKGYELALESRDLMDFQEMCHFHQTSARSAFTSARMCVLHTATGTRSLIEGEYEVTGECGVQVSDPGEQLTLLREAFLLDLPRMPKSKADTLSQRAQLRAIAWENRARQVWSMAGRLAAA
jgi:N-hydroxyarylamine O-acetyltransferase